jgi:hypothetical protein
MIPYPVQPQGELPRHFYGGGFFFGIGIELKKIIHLQFYIRILDKIIAPVSTGAFLYIKFFSH